MEKASKNCVVRLPETIHRQAKLRAFNEGKTLQEWVLNLINLNLLQNSELKWLCQECGGWKLKGMQLALLRECQKCKRDTATFPCSTGMPSK
jgi:hypothetical protein